MSGNAGRIARGVVENVSPRVAQKAAGIVNDAVEKQQAEVNEPLAQVPAQTLRAMIPINQGKNKSNQVQQDTQSEQNQIQFSSVNDILREIKKKTFYEDDYTESFIMDINQFDNIVGLFNQAIEKTQNSKDLSKIIRTLDLIPQNLVDKFNGSLFEQNDIWAKEAALCDKLYNKIVDANYSNDGKLIATFCRFLDSLSQKLVPISGGYAMNMLDDLNVKEMKSNNKAKLLLTHTKIAYLALRIRPCINFSTDFEKNAILNIWSKLDDLSKIPDANASGLIEEWFGKGETIDSVKEKGFTSLGATKPTDISNVATISTWLDQDILKNYLKTQTEDKQKELLSCFYPPGDGEQEKQIRQELDTMLEEKKLPTPDLNGKHYDEQRLIWVSDEVAPAQTEEQALVQQQAQVANTTQKVHAEKPFRLTKELANDIYELYSNDGSIFNLETLQEDNRILEQQLEDKDKLSTKISHLKTYSNDLWRKIYTEDPVINSAIQRVYFLLVDLENRKTIEEKKQIFEQNKERFASLGFSSLENFYATMHGEKEPE